MSQLVVDSDLNTDTTGAIKTYLDDDIAGKQQQVQLWFATALGSVPFLNYGNDLNKWIFASMNDQDILSKINQLLDILRQKFGLAILSEDHNIDKDNKKIEINLTLQNNVNFTLKI
jgi:hypothetical protein